MVPELSASPARAETKPIVRMEPPRGFFNFGLAELWRFRDLLYFFIWRDVKVRYKQTVFGAAWALIQPVLMLGVLMVFLGRVPGIAPAGVSYSLFALCGLVPWVMFAQSMTSASNSLVENTNLVTKAYFPRLVLPLAAAGSHVVDHLIALALTVVVLLVTGAGIHAQAASLPVWTLLAVTAAVTVGTWLSALNVRYRDVRYAIPFVAQLWLFATPVAYDAAILPERWRPLLGLNPMTGVVEGYRWALLGIPLSGRTVIVSAVTTLVTLILGVVYFRHTEDTVADRI